MNATTPDRRHDDALAAALAALRGNEHVRAVGAYGSTRGRRWTAASDIDLLVVLDVDPPVESVRLRADGVPIDVNLRSADAGPHGIGGASFVPEVQPLWDPHDVFLGIRTTATPPDPSSARMLRFALAHSIDKARQLEASLPLGRLFAGGEVSFVVRAYYQARSLWFPGPVAGLRDLERSDPEFVRALLAVGAGPDLPSVALTSAAEIALAPIGGLWRDDEVFVVNWRPDQRTPEGEAWAQAELGSLLSVGGEQRKLV